MITFGTKGEDELELTVDFETGLEPHDPDTLMGLLTADMLRARVVRVVVSGPSTTDRAYWTSSFPS